MTSMTPEEMRVQIGQLNNRVFVLEKLIDQLIETFNTHIHDVLNEPSYGLVTYMPKDKMRGRE
jgi:hypothetical protein